MKPIFSVLLALFFGCASKQAVAPPVSTPFLGRAFAELRKLPMPSPNMPYQHEKLNRLYLSGFEAGWKMIMKAGPAGFGASVVAPETLQPSETEQVIWLEGYHAAHDVALKRIHELQESPGSD